MINARVGVKNLAEALILAIILSLIYIGRDIFNVYVLIGSSLLLFVVIYNVYVYRSGRYPSVLPLWLFPLSWLFSLVTLVFIGRDYALLIYYFTLFIAIGVISKPSTVEKIFVSLKNYLLYIFIGAVILVMIYSPSNRLWVSIGPFIEYFAASYLFLEYAGSLARPGTMGVEKWALRVPAGMLFSLLPSLIIFVDPWMIIYSVVINTIKISLMETRLFIPIILVFDVFTRFLLVGGLEWIIGML